MRHLILDDTGLPTGATAETPATAEPLGDTVFDDGFDQVADGAVFAVSGGGRRLEVRFERRLPRRTGVRARRRGGHLLRTDGRAHRRTAPRRLPIRAAG